MISQEATRQLKAIFKKGSKTYFNSSVFFPPQVRQDVLQLYGFVRVADNYVDAVPQDKEGFLAFCAEYRRALGQDGPIGNVVIDSFIELARRRKFDPAWTEAFLHSMELDLKKTRYDTMDETLEYIYGSAEVIGLYMAAIMGLPHESLHSAQMLGRSMQLINFIRDIAEDNTLGRIYLPLHGSGLMNLSQEEARAKPDLFKAFIQGQAAIYQGWQKQAEAGYRFIPRRALSAIKTAADMYLWTSLQIHRDPFIVFRRKVKPSKLRILLTLAGNFLFYRAK